MHDGDRRDGNRDAEANPTPVSGAERRSADSPPASGRSSPDDSAGMSRQLMRLSSVGLEFAAAVLLLGGIGYWIDLTRQHETPYLGIVGVMLGFVVGMYRLIRVAQDVGGR